MVGVNKKKVIFVVSFIIGIFSLIGIGFNKQEEKILVSNAKEYKETLDSEYNFYNCAVGAYNEENKTELTQLTDVQLASIKSLSCSYIAATDEPIAGGDILKKMTSLESLDVSVVDNLDLSNNKKLKSLSIHYGLHDGELDLSNNTELESLEVYVSAFENYNLSKNTKLNRLVLAMLPITSVDLSQNTSLTELALGYTQLSEIDLTNNINLKNLDLEYNQLTSIDLTKNTKLELVLLNDNQLSSLDLTNNTLLKNVYANSNLLNSVDLSKNLKIETMDFSDNQLEEVNISNNTLLKEVDLSNNKLKAIDVSKNINLTEFYIEQNLLETIDLRKNIKLNNVDISYNKLDTIYMYDDYEINSYQFYGQTNNQTVVDFGNDRIINPSNELEFYVGDRILMHFSELEIPYDEFVKKLGLKNLTSQIIRNGYIIESGYVSSGDKVIIYDEQEEILSMNFQIIVNDSFNDTIFYNCVIDAYNFENNEELSYTSVLTDAQLASIKSLVCEYEDIRDTKGLEKMTSLETLILTWGNLEEIDLTQNTNLTYLDLNTNSLNEIDLSQNKKLEEVYLGQNYLVNIDLSNNSEINRLDLYSNYLVSIDLSNNKKLIEVDLGWNDLENLNISNNQLLETLDVSGNELEQIDLTNNTELSDLNLDSNCLVEIDLTNNKKLVAVDLSWNELTNLNISQNELLESLDVYYNELEQIDLSKNTNLKILSISSDKLTQLDFSKNILLEDLELEAYNLKELTLENNKKLKSLEIYADLLSLDLSQNNELAYLDISITNNSVVYKNNIKQLSNDLIKFPESLKTELSYTNCWSDIDDSLWFDQENMTVTTNNVGNYTVLMRYNNTDEEESSISVDITYNVNSVELMSLNYIVNEDKNYIYTGMDTSSDRIIPNVRVHYLDDANVYVENNKLKLKYNDELLRELDIININFGELQVNNGVVSYNQEMTVENLKQKITTNGVTYKIYKGEEEITSGNIPKGAIIKVYKDEYLLEQYTITDEYLELNESLNVEQGIIYKLTPGVTIEEILENVITSGKITIKDKDNNTIDNNSRIKTGYKISIELSSGTVEYTLSVLGDTNGDGNVGVGDVRIIANYIAGPDESELTPEEVLAANVNGDGNISVSDVRRLANYVLDNSIKLGE